MKILSRYIVREHIGPFIFSFSIITLFFLLNKLFQELGKLLSRGLHFFVIMEFFVLHMGWIVAITLPMAVLPAVLMAFGRMSSDNEITAIKASGISLYRVIAPVLLAATLLCGFCIWFGNSVLPEMNHRAALLSMDISRKRPTLAISPGVTFEVGTNTELTVGRIEESEGSSKLWGVVIDDYSKVNVTQTIVADSGEIHFDKELGKIILDLYEGELHKIDYNKLPEIVRMQFPHLRMSHSVAGLTLTRSNSRHRSDREKSAREMLEEVKTNDTTIAAQLRNVEKRLSVPLREKLADLLARRPITEWQPEEIDTLLARSRRPAKEGEEKLTLTQLETRSLSAIRSSLASIRTLKKRTMMYMVEVHKKYSIPVTCLVFVLIGAPLGIMARRGGMAVGGGMSLFFFLLYWAFLIAGEELADRLIISPFVAMWSADILVGAAGVYLVIRKARDIGFVDWSLFRKLRISRRGRAEMKSDEAA